VVGGGVLVSEVVVVGGSGVGVSGVDVGVSTVAVPVVVVSGPSVPPSDPAVVVSDSESVDDCEDWLPDDPSPADEPSPPDDLAASSEALVTVSVPSAASGVDVPSLVAVDEAASVLVSDGASSVVAALAPVGVAVEPVVSPAADSAWLPVPRQPASTTTAAIAVA
jgi:hypothetical protein